MSATCACRMRLSGITCSGSCLHWCQPSQPSFLASLRLLSVCRSRSRLRAFISSSVSLALVYSSSVTRSTLSNLAALRAACTCTQGGHSVAIRDNQAWQSETIRRGNQRQSGVAIRYNQVWQSETIRRGNQKQSGVAIRCVQGPSEALRGTQRPSEAIRGTPS